MPSYSKVEEKPAAQSGTEFILSSISDQSLIFGKNICLMWSIQIKWDDVSHAESLLSSSPFSIPWQLSHHYRHPLTSDLAVAMVGSSFQL